jgi:hypothetical protein
MVRQTSIEAFHTIKECGLLSRRRFEVYEYIFKNGPISANEMCRSMLTQGKTFSSYNARFSELRDRKVIAEVGTKQDEITKQKVIIWDVTGKLPEECTAAKSEAWLLLKRVYDEVNPAFMSPKLNKDIKKYLKI